ncbi:MAG: hypothetical protein PHQ43_07380 [Dehalococcoidales bacterium]|nr:hypothetical protein [Dehalococcoidales bacterium]
MPAEEITSSVEMIEVEAEKALKEARRRASEIILKAKEEARVILASEVSLDEVKRECERTLDTAREKAAREIEQSKKDASEIRAGSVKKAAEIADRIVNIVSGAGLR